MGTDKNRVAVLTSSAVAMSLALLLAQSYGWRQSALFLVGLCAGLILYHAAFGFTAAWRELAQTGNGTGLRAQLVMLAITVVVFSLLIERGEVGGVALRGSVAPLSIAVILGAFVFGIGMQLGGGCASGTLFTAGGGNARMVITLFSFIAGSVLGSWHWGAWQQAPAFAPVALTQQFGVMGGIAISLALFATIYMLTHVHQRRRQPATKEEVTNFSLFRGPWPLIAGALALAAVNCTTLILAGRPWGVTSAFTLWGGKLLALLGFDLSSWEYWARPSSAAALEQSLFADVTSVMNLGIILGALLAAGLAGKFSPSLRIPARSVLAAIVGGIMLGYGARIAYGCNIGAYFGGISSTSLHGWLWFGAAFAGSTLGTRIRPYFGL